MASSFDRLGGNADYSYYESTGSVHQTGEVDPVTVVTLDGPGVLSRFWMPHKTADLEFNVKVLLDDVAVIDTNSKTFLAGNYGYVDGALGTTFIGGQVSYEPIVFSESQTLKIVSNNIANMRHYYQWNYLKLPSGTDVTSYTGTLTPEQTAARNSAISMLDNVGSNPAGVSPASVILSSAAQSIAPGESLALGDISGSGRIRALNLKMATDATDAEMDSLRLRVRYDGIGRHAIDVPVGHFFGAGHGRAPYESMPLGASEANEFYSYWPMPYRRGVVVELYNDGGAAVPIDSASVEYEAADIDYATGYFHARYNSVDTTSDPIYELLHTAGQGHYVGNLLWLDRQNVGTGSRYGGRSVLEGDDIITVNVDGTDPVVLNGTGLEDAYNAGYYYNHVGVHPDEEAYPDFGIAPYHGLLRCQLPLNHGLGDDYAHTDQYRWLIPDPVPFTDGIKVEMEQYGFFYGASFGSVAFYYLLPPLGDANGDDVVDFDDFAALRSAFGESGESLAADLDDDGDVDGDDLDILLATFGMVRSAGASPPALPDNLPVPEPAAVILLAGGLPVLLKPRRKG